MLLRMDSLCGKPVCLWLPERFKKPNTSTYVQGVEGLTDYTGPVSEGFDVIELPTADYLMFQGEPFAEEDYCDAISAVQQAMNGYDPDIIGYCWDDSNPRTLVPLIDMKGIQIRRLPVRAHQPGLDLQSPSQLRRQCFPAFRSSA